MHILEDHHGFMWFSTWNGLSKFDGYDFRNYKASKDNLLNLTNNRIDFMELMESNMDNGELMVDELARELALSRSVFFKKLKALTGLAPIEFIREIRINRAAKLIEEGEWSMIEIAEKVGINDSRYFSKCFKHQFGITPTEYRDKMKNLS